MRLIRRLTAGLAVVLVLASAGYVLLGRAYVSRHEFVSRYETSLEFTAVAGEQIVLGVRTHEGIQGYCAAPYGLQLSLDDGGDPLPVVPPQAVNWGSRITTRSDDKPTDCVIGGVFTVPDRAGSLISGQLKGDIMYPTSYMGGFTDQTKAISIYVRITVVDRAPTWGSRSALAVAHWICAVVALALVVLTWRLLGSAIGWRPGTWERRTGKSWLGDLAAVSIVGGALFIVAFEIIDQGQASVDDAHAPTPVPIVLVPLLMFGVGAALGIRGAVWFRRARHQSG